jgi:hypothetical protein
MSSRPSRPANNYAQLPAIEPMKPADITALIEEFMARNAERPGLAPLPGLLGGVAFLLEDDEDATVFALEATPQNVIFSSGVDFPHTEAIADKLADFFEQVQERIAFGELQITEEGVQWQWNAPALHYPYFHGNATHAIRYADYLNKGFWVLTQQLAEGKTTVQKACALALLDGPKG